MSTQPNRYQSIDGIRFYSAALIFLVHIIGAISTDILRIKESDLITRSADPGIAALALLADFGHHGVDLFFIISGFLMMRVSMNGRGLNPALTFLWHRFLRIYPAFALSLIAGAAIRCLVFDWPFKPSDFLANFVFLNALPPLGVLPYNFVTWSLGYEFAFYFLVPIIFLGRDLRWKFLIAVGLLIGGALVIPDTYIRFTGLLLGAVIGSISDDWNRRIARHAPLYVLLTLYVYLLIGRGMGLFAFQAFHLLFLPVSGLLFIKVVFEENALNRFFASPSFASLGRLSYSFYLWHAVCISLTLQFGLTRLGVLGQPVIAAVSYTVLSLLLSLIAASVSYELTERWYFSRRRRSPTKPLTSA